MSGRSAAVSPARRIALEVLTGVREREAYANLLLPSLLGRQRPPVEPVAERLPVGERPGHVDPPLGGLADLQRGADVRVSERGRGPGVMA